MLSVPHRRTAATSLLIGTKHLARILLHDYSGHPFQVELSRGLARRGHEVRHLFSASVQTPQGQLVRQPEDAPTFSIAAIDLGRTISKYNFFDRFRLESRYAKMLVAECQRFQPDVVMSANTPSLVQHALARWSQRSRCRLATWVQDLYGLAAYRILSKKLPGVGHLVGQYFMYLDRCSARASDAVVVITEDFVPYMEREGIRRERIHVVPNWAPIESLPVEVKDNAWARSQGLSPQPVRFLYSGTLSIRHNPELLVQLALRLEQWKNAELVVISVGPGIDHIRRRAEELSLTCVKLLPFQPFENMAEVFGSADVLVSILEPDAGVFCVPSKVLSYMCAGRSQLVGMPLENLSARLVEGNGMGLVSAADDVDDFLKNAETLYRDSEMRDLCGQRARAFAERNFELEHICDRFTKILGIDTAEVAAAPASVGERS